MTHPLEKQTNAAEAVIENTGAAVRPIGDLNAIRADIDELMAENRWPAIVTQYHPLDEKAPEAAAGRSHYVRSKIAFALGQLGRFDDALAQLDICVTQFPGSFMYRSSLAYTAYNSLWAAQNREYALSGDEKRRRIELAHTHFKRAQELRPDGVTNYYRQGMLLAKLENKPEKALPLFRLAISNWEGLTEEDRQTRHQEHKNYVKSLYQAASAALKQERGGMALAWIEKCLAEDESSNHLNRLFKFFALGKVRFHLGQYEQARDALKFALQARRKNQPADFVNELLARVYLALNDPGRAERILAEVPERRRRPYIRWTEAEVLLARGDREAAKKVLVACADRDRQARHKALIRLARIEFEDGRFTHAAKCAAVADAFFRERWGNPCLEGVYWQAISALESGDRDKAAAFAEELEAHFPESYRMRQLRERLS